MKKYKYPVITVLITGFLLLCASVYHPAAAKENSRRIVASIFPEYDWVMNILGENPADIETTMLLDKGVDLHSYQPAVDDILKVSACDLFIYVGGESDLWVKDALREAANPDMVVINLLDVLGDAAKEEELTEGMQDEDHKADADGEEKTLQADILSEINGQGRDQGETEYDEHVWLSLQNAETFVNAIATAIASIDPENASVYENNAAEYCEKLSSLDQRFQDAVSKAPVKTLLFGDRFPFRYLTDDYGLTCYAAFAGCSAETEASFETITFLAQKLDELSLRYVMTTESSDQRIAETIIQNTKTKDQKILVLDSMQSVTSFDMQNGAAYLSIMESNLDTLTKALTM